MIVTSAIHPLRSLALLVGGPSSEHEVSLATGRQILRSLDRARYRVVPVIISRRGAWMILDGDDLDLDDPGPLEIAASERHAIAMLRNRGVEAVFIALHGEYGEDGTVQRILEAEHMPYTGSDARASALGMDKVRSLSLFRDRGIAVPPFVAFDAADFRDTPDMVAQTIAGEIGLPVVTKPADRGSSVGVRKVSSPEELAPAISDALSYSGRVMAQRYIKGKEITCGVIDDGAGGSFALQPTEIVPREAEFFDYRSKYTPGMSEEITPPRLPADAIERIRHIARFAHETLGCRGMSRTDMIVDDLGEIHVLEINTIPGMTETSLLPQAAQAAGISFPELLHRIIESACRDIA